MKVLTTTFCVIVWAALGTQVSAQTPVKTPGVPPAWWSGAAAADPVAGTGTDSIGQPNGTYNDYDKLAAVARLGTDRAWRIDGPHLYFPSGSWYDITGPGWFYSAYGNKNPAMADYLNRGCMITARSLPTNVAGVTWAQARDGVYDSYYRQRMRNAMAAGHRNTIWVMESEGNAGYSHTFPPNSGSTPAEFQAGLAHIIDVYRDELVKLTPLYGPNNMRFLCGAQAGQGTNTDAGDTPNWHQWVPLNADGVGVDDYLLSYGHPGYPAEQLWLDMLYAGSNSRGTAAAPAIGTLQFWANWCATHHMQLWIPEWGAESATDGSSGGSADLTTEVHVLGSPTGGTFTMTVSYTLLGIPSTHTTSTLPRNPTAGQVENALRTFGLSASDVTVSSTGGGVLTVRWTGRLHGQRPHISIANSLTGGTAPYVWTPAGYPAQTVAGGGCGDAPVLVQRYWEFCQTQFQRTIVNRGGRTVPLFGGEAYFNLRAHDGDHWIGSNPAAAVPTAMPNLAAAYRVYYGRSRGTATATTATSRSAGYELAPAHPNPTSGDTQLLFSLPKPAVVSMAVFDRMGRRVAQVLTNEARAAGQFTASFDASKLASGLYVCRLTANGVSVSQPLSVE